MQKMALQLAGSLGQIATMQSQHERAVAALNAELQERDAQMHKTMEQYETKIAILRDPRALVVPDGTEVIGEEQYAGSAYERVLVPKSVSEIRNGAFKGCRSLREVIFEEGSALRTIGWDAFGECGSLAKINLPARLERIGENCFARSGLELLSLPASVRKISSGAFSFCGQLRSARLNEGLEKLGEYVFAGSAIRDVQLPSTLKTIEAETFCGCKNLKRVEVPAGVERIGGLCF